MPGQFTDTLRFGSFKQVIESKQIGILKRIKNIFDKNSTKYVIIIYPNSKRLLLNFTDIVRLEEIFSKENIFNYSGRNKFSLNYYYYYDSRHARRIVGNEILNDIYKGIN